MIVKRLNSKHKVEGELIVNKDRAIFSPLTDPYGPDRIVIRNHCVTICPKKDDDSMITVTGYTLDRNADADDERFMHVSEHFLPRL